MYVYMLLCRDGTLYTGITDDLIRRLQQHRGEKPGGARYTAAHVPLGYAAAWQTPDRSSALRLEYRLKQLRRSEKDALISGEASLEYEKVILSPDIACKSGTD